MNDSINQILNTRRVAKNTLFLYVRMLFTMIVSLYTSRILLNALGVEDYGLYNVVAGLIVLFSFLQSAFSSSTTRFIGVAITKENSDEVVSKVYSTAYFLHGALVLFFILGLETVGVWYMNHYMNIPSGRESASWWVYHLTVVNACLLTLRVPEHSMVVAFEKMNFFAFCGIIEAVLKLVIVFLIIVSPIDRLISYTILVVFVNFLINVAHFFYTHHCLFVKPKFVKPERSIIQGMFSFIGWNSLGGIANIGYQQGINLILNYFYGVALNAAMGIANQVKGAVYSFVSNIRVASDPQIIKSYSLSEFSYCRQLMSRISRLSHYLLLLIAIPVIINIDFILELWLKNPPNYASSFVVLMLVYSMLDGLMGPLWILNQASGKIRLYQIVRTIFYLFNIPITYFAVKLFSVPEVVIVVGIIITAVLFVIQIPICIKPLNMTIVDYFRDVLFPVIVVSLLSMTVSFFSARLFIGPWSRIISTTLINTSILGISVYYLGITERERKMVLSYLNRKLHLKK